MAATAAVFQFNINSKRLRVGHGLSITELGISLRGVRMPCVICNERRESQTALISYDDSVAIFRLTRMCNEA